MDHARAVIIGGGVGGTSIAYHLAELGWTDIVLLERAELTSGSTFHSAGLVGQLREPVTLTRMMMYGAELYRRLAAETGRRPVVARGRLAPPGVDAGAVRGAPPPGRLGQDLRPAARPDPAAEAQALFPLMSTDGVLGAVCLPTDGWLDPSGLAQALAAGPASAGRAIRTHTRVVAIGVERGRVTGVTVEHRGERADDRGRRRRQRRRACSRRRSAGWPGSPCRSSRWPTSTCSPNRSTGVHPGPAAAARPGQPRLLPRGGRRPVHGRLRARSGAVVARRDPGRLQRQAPRARLAALRAEIMDGAVRRVPAIADAGVNRMINGPEALHPRQRVHPRRERGPRLLRGRRVLRPRHRRGRRHRPPGGQLDRRRRARARPVEDGHPAVRRASTAARPTPSPGSIEIYATYYDIHYPNEERQAGRPLRLSPAYDAAGRARARPSARSPAGSGRTGSSRTRPPATRRCARAAGPASTGRRRSARRPSRRAPPRPLRRDVLRQDRGLRTAAPAAFLQRLCANDIDRPVGLDHVHPDAQPARRDRVRLHRDPPRRRPLPDRHRHGVRQPRPRRGCATHLPDDGSVQVRDVTSARLLRAVGAAGARHPRGRSRATTLDEAFPYLTAREITVGRSRARAAGDLRRRARLGALRPDRVRAGAVGRRSGTPGRARPGRRRLPGDRRPSAREGLPRLVERHHPGRDAVRGGPRVRGRARQGVDFIGRDALVAAKAAAPQAAALPRPRRPALGRLGNEPVRVDGDVVGRVTSGGYGFAVERSIAYAYLPPDAAAIGTRGEVEVFGEWVGFEVWPSPSTTRRARGSARDRRRGSPGTQGPASRVVGHEPDPLALAVIEGLGHDLAADPPAGETSTSPGSPIGAWSDGT